jgi:hypothetical protein
MTRETKLDGLGAAPRWIAVSLGIYLSVDLLALYLWNAAGQTFPLQAPIDSASALPVSAMAGVSLWLCLVVLRGFPAGAPLRPAWMLMAFASAAQAVSGVLVEFLGSGRAHGMTGYIRTVAPVAGGPVRLALLAVALLVVLRILRKFGFDGEPGATDWAVWGMVFVFTLCRFAEAALSRKQVSVGEWSELAELPLLCVLFLEAMALRHSVVRMGNGPIARCWGAFAVGVFLTGLAELALWLVPHYSSASLAIAESLTRFLTAAVFALVPAYQLAAQRRASKPAGSAPEDWSTAVPAVAR